MFNFIKNRLQKIFAQVTSHLKSFFNRTTIDQAALQELEVILLSSDVGVSVTRSIIDQLKKKIEGGYFTGAELKQTLYAILVDILMTNKSTLSINNDKVFLFVGINGSGKTTSIGKLAHFYVQQGKKVLLVAGDTFRAAATEQLNEWATRSGADIVCGVEGQDPASLVFKACEKFKKENYDIIIIDTAGRLHTKINLMNELAKIKHVVSGRLADQTITTLLTIDSMLGQSSFEQAKLFRESTDVNGIILTKMDGTGKGGIVFAIARELAIPVIYLTFGEHSDHIKLFNAQEYVKELLG